MTLSLDTLSFLLTYLLHSTLLLGGVWLLLRLRIVRAPSLEDALWKVGLIGGLVTSSVQVGLGVQPLGGQVELTAPAEPRAVVPPNHALVQRALRTPIETATGSQLAWLSNVPDTPAHERTTRRGRRSLDASSKLERAVMGSHVVTPQRAQLTPAKVAHEADSASTPLGITGITGITGRAPGSAGSTPPCCCGSPSRASDCCASGWLVDA